MMLCVDLDLSTFLNLALLGTTTATLLVVMDPLGNLPVFLALTGRMDDAGRRRAARTATLVSLGVISVFAAFGRTLLVALGISVPALQLSGGLLLLVVAMELLTGGSFGGKNSSGGDPDLDHPEGGVADVALVPLGTPLLAGPGAIVAVMLAMETDGGTPATWVSVALSVLICHFIIWLSMHFGVTVHRWMGDAATTLLTRLAGMLLAAIAVQLMADAVFAFIGAHA